MVVQLLTFQSVTDGYGFVLYIVTKKNNYLLKINKMKKHVSIMLVTVLLMCFITSCKKSSVTKDYTVSVKGKTWWGQLTNAGETIQYYSVYFNGDGSLLWTQRAGSYTGKWVVNNNHLTVDLLTPAVQIKADISDDNILKNIVSNNSTAVNSGEMIANPTIPLDNTVWKGMLLLSNGTQETFQLRFLTGSKVETKIGTTTLATSPYTRSVSGAVIQFNVGAYPYFAVISSDNEMKGHWSTTIYNYFLWQTTKQ